MAYKDELIQRVKKIQADIAIGKEEKKLQKNKEFEAFKKLPGATISEFWCDVCQMDFSSPAYKIWNDFFSIGTWQSICPFCDRPVYRHITDKKNDPYYEKSIKIMVMRSLYEKDLLRPEDYGFKSLYGEAYKSYFSTLQKMDEEIFNRQASLGLKGISLKQKSDLEKLKEEFGY